MSDLIERANRKYGVEFLHGGVATFDVRIKHPIVADLLAELSRLTTEVERLRADAGRDAIRLQDLSAFLARAHYNANHGRVARALELVSTGVEYATKLGLYSPLRGVLQDAAMTKEAGNG